MEIAATISNRLFSLSVELIPPWAWLLPALLASLLQAMVIRPLIVTTRHLLGLIVLKLEDTCPFVLKLSASISPRWLEVVNKVTSEVIRVVLSEQTSLWVLYLMAPNLFDIRFKLKVEIGMLRLMLLLLLKNMTQFFLRLVMRLNSVMSAFMEGVR
ncbi:hypothetical protein HU200_004288 [Digitaria exilis]|uniref:Uncharacterized protein n=1 Tax=Digitaria exilis TaxID=1010633 RepID=A0A835ATT7_9POAL|nr:hypothetical protein HU200_051275 [Digitaria exilis]KAF8775727.1 hypothetical protein HU200_004288 [Digitaria exilis]